MALARKKSEAVHTRTGSEKASLKADFDNNKHTELEVYPPEAAIIYQMQQMQEDIDELRRYIVSDEMLVTSPGRGLPTTATARGSGLLWNNRGVIKIG